MLNESIQYYLDNDMYEYLMENLSLKEKLQLPLYQILPEDFMDEYFKYLSPTYMATKQKLSENFIEKHFQYFQCHLDQIVQFQNLSNEFLLKHNLTSNILLSEFNFTKFNFNIKSHKDSDKIFVNDFCHTYQEVINLIKDIKLSARDYNECKRKLNLVHKSIESNLC